MPKNKNAQYRYRLLDECFQRSSGCTIDELVEYVSRKLREDFGIDGVSKRTIYADINLMRSEWPRGFSAPIEVKNGKYRYANAYFSIYPVRLKAGEVKLLQDLILFLSGEKEVPEYQKKKVIAILQKIVQKYQVEIIEVEPFIYKDYFELPQEYSIRELTEKLHEWSKLRKAERQRYTEILKWLSED